MSEGWVLYDGECGFCKSWIDRLHPSLRSRGFKVAPLQEAWVQKRLKLPADKLLEEMRVITPDQQVLGGADAVVYLAGQIPWGWPLYAVSFIPGIKRLLHVIYRFVASHRHYFSSTCSIGENPHPMGWADWVPVFVLPISILIFYPRAPAWGFMWILAFAIFAGFKWLSLAEAESRYPEASPLRRIQYLFFWPGMEAGVFLAPTSASLRPSRWIVCFALMKTLFGAWLFWGIADMVRFPMMKGWIGLLGVIFMLHFGLFHLLALFWQQRGIPVEPIMKAPVLAQSLGDFWGHRWNLAFRTLAHRFAYQPLHKRGTVAQALVISFLISGVLHDLVISVPAQGGYGLPTAYFLLQALGILLERSRAGQAMGLGTGITGWVFTMLITAGPVYWLFHPTFVVRIWVPFMAAAGAI
jgi:predicted DCC family thiol-disulfide oxidoreductase YuxK